MSKLETIKRCVKCTRYNPDTQEEFNILQSHHIKICPCDNIITLTLTKRKAN